VLSASEIKVWFPIKSGVFRRTVGHVKAVDGISLAIRTGQTIGVVGESGSGKTTLGLALLRLVDATGAIAYARSGSTPSGAKRCGRCGASCRIVFQDPFSSLSPRLSVGEIVEEGLKVHGLGGSPDERRRLIEAVLHEVGLDPQFGRPLPA